MASGDDGDEAHANGAQTIIQMTQSVSIQPMPAFNPDTEVGASLGVRWNNWTDDFEMYILASGITDPKRKRALLLYQAGQRVREIFRQLENTGDNNDYDTAKAKLKGHFEPQKNRRYEVYNFRQSKQERGETLDQFHTRLRSRAQTCEYADVNFEIEQQILVGGLSSKIRKSALKDPKYNLASMLLDGRRDEQSKYQNKDIESNTGQSSERHEEANNIEPDKANSRKCYNCGGMHYPGKCPAKGKQCLKCNKMNHFAKVCRGNTYQKRPTYDRKSRQNSVQPVNESKESSESTDEDYLYSVNNTKSPKVKVTVCKHSFQATIDTGATVNVIDQNTYSNMTGVKLEKTKVKAFAYSAETPVKFIGKFVSAIETRKRITAATFYVTETLSGGNLISSTTAQELGLITIHVNKISTQSDSKVENMVKKYDTLFNGLGKLKAEPVKLNIDRETAPKAQPQRRIPYHIREKVGEALKELEDSDIIERVPEDQPTPWVSPIVAVPKKDGSVRICIDMRVANEAIKRVRHPIPTVEEISFELNGAKYFSKLDLSQAYHQLELDEDSRYITTFTTHLGIYRYKRLNYGTNAAAEIFQHTLQTQLHGLKGVRNIADDIIVYGKTRDEHDTNLEKCLRRLNDKGLKLNKPKCMFLTKTLNFFGQVFSDSGMCPDPKRVSDLREAPIPKNVHEVRSLLGMANYSSNYIANFATITEPLRALTKKNAMFQWTDKHQKAFDNLKTALSSAPCMAYFNISKETTVTVDASPVGVSAIISQSTKEKNENKVIAYASRALTAVETRYSQTEKEALAIVWAIEHFHLYLYGHDFVLVTDHKPLEVIYGSSRSKPSARIERWVLRLQPYTFKVVYKPGATNPADYLSRHPVPTKNTKNQEMTESYINFVTTNSIPKAMTLEEIKKATDKDETLRAVRAAIKLNKWHYDSVKQFKTVRDELSVTSDGIVLRGTRIVIPESLQKRAIAIAHESHPGLNKTKSLIREKIWFPNIDKMVKDAIDRCIPCQAVGRPPPPEPLCMTDMPKGQWETVHIDFYGPLPSGEYLLVAIDRYSRYPEVEIVRSTKASTVIPKLDQMFARHGIPIIIKSDNGPPFNSYEYIRYLEALGIKASFSTPVWPQGNSEVERFMQPLGKALKTAVIEGRPWQQELNRFLLQYRTTPHVSTNVPPAELLFNRTVRGKLPVLHKRNIVNRHKIAQKSETAKKDYNKKFADKKRNVRKSDITTGDYVLVRQERKNKLTPNFNPNPYVVINRQHSRVSARAKNGHIITRNVSHFKKMPNPEQPSSDEEEDSQPSQPNEETNDNDDNHGGVQDNVDNGEDQVRRSTRDTRRPQRYGQPIL